jgi:hypothetical protein
VAKVLAASLLLPCQKSVYLLFEDLGLHTGSRKARKTFLAFVFALWKRLREEINAGFDRKHRELYAFETMLSGAPGEIIRSSGATKSSKSTTNTS